MQAIQTLMRQYRILTYHGPHSCLLDNDMIDEDLHYT